jgi:hypothetical protein
LENNYNMEIKKLKDHLPKGWRRLIQEQTGFTITYISYVVLGYRPCDTQAAKQIMEVALNLAEKNKKQEEEFKRNLERL